MSVGPAMRLFSLDKGVTIDCHMLSWDGKVLIVARGDDLLLFLSPNMSGQLVDTQTEAGERFLWVSAL